MKTVYWCKPIFGLKPHFCDYITKDIKTHLFNLVHMIALNLQSKQFLFLIMVRKSHRVSGFLRTPYFKKGLMPIMDYCEPLTWLF